MTVGVNEISITTGGLTYEVRIFVPAAATKADLLPTVVVWHGLTVDGPAIAEYTGFEELADTEDFLAIFPTGHPAPDLPVFSLGNGWELPDWHDSSGKDDVAFARDLLDELEDNWCSDTTRTYSAGDSNGAFFTSIMICELSERFAAAASNSGVIHPESCNPSKPVPYLAIHGTLDEFVPFESGSVSVLGEEVTTPLGMRETFQQFVDDFACDPEPVASKVGEDTTRFDYVGCEDEVPLTFYVIDGDGHTWAGSVGIDEQTTGDISATEEIWNFFVAS